MRSRALSRNLYHVLLWIIALIFFAPVLWVFLAAFKTKDQILAMPPAFLFMPTLDNFRELFSREEVVASLWNSATLSVAAVLVAIMVSYLAAYSFSRFQPRGTDFMMFVLLSIRMVPAAAVVLPIYLMYAAVGWRDSWTGIMLFYAMFSIPFSVWILKGFIDGVSPRFDETAQVNGGSRWHTLFKVILPQVRPGLVAAFIFNLIFVWNEYIFNFMIGGPNTTTIPVTLSTGLYADAGVDWTFVASLTTTYLIAPVIAVFLFQRFLLIGMTFGTVRGEV